MKKTLVMLMLLAMSGLKLYASGDTTLVVSNYSTTYSIDMIVLGLGGGAATCGYPANVFNVGPRSTVLDPPTTRTFHDIGDVCASSLGWQYGYDCVHNPPTVAGSGWTMAVAQLSGYAQSSPVGNYACAGGTTSVSIPGCGSTTLNWTIIGTTVYVDINP